MRTTRCGVIAVLLVIISFCMTSCGEKAIDPGELFRFSLSNEQGEKFYIIEEYIGTSKKLVIPSEYNGVPIRVIAERAFEGKGLKSVTISEGIIEIGSWAFAYNQNLKTINIPETVESIGAHAFEFAEKLKQIALPEKVKILGECAFWGCSSLNEIVIPGGVETIEGGTFGGCDSLKKVQILEGVQEIGRLVFNGCPLLEELAIPSSVKVIDKKVFDSPEIKLKHIKYGGAEEEWKSFEIKNIPENCEIIFYNQNDANQNTEMEQPENTDKTENTESAKGLKFELNENGTYYRITGVMGSVDKNIVIPELYKGIPVKEVAEKAFDGCSNIETISMPKSILTIGNSVFYGCDKLTSVSMPGVLQMESGVFTGCSSIKDLTIPADFISLVKSQPLESITITQVQTTIIRASAFYKHKSLKKVTISQGITEIGEKAFSECLLLETVSFSNGLQILGKSAFTSCPTLKEVTLPATLTRIYVGAFSRCTSLKSIVIPGSVHTIGTSAFLGCTALQQATIENGVKAIGSSAFMNCNIKEIIIPESVNLIEEDPFDGNPLERAIFKNTTGWKIGHSVYDLLAKDIILSENELSNAEYAASILLRLQGTDRYYMSRN